MYLLLNKLNWTEQIFNGRTSDIIAGSVSVYCSMFTQRKYLLSTLQIIKMSLITCSELGVGDHMGACSHSGVMGIIDLTE